MSNKTSSKNPRISFFPKSKKLKHIPFELQEKIIERLPVRSVIRSRSVSKSWKSFIDSSDFISAYSSVKTRRHLLLINCKTKDKSRRDIFNLAQALHSFVNDDETFPMKSSFPTLPVSIKQLHQSDIIGCSHGLLCFFGHFLQNNNRKDVVVIWNPSIKKSLVVDVPDTLDPAYYDSKLGFGFGVCPVTNDPMIVKFTRKRKPNLHWQVSVYSLTSKEWRNPSGYTPNQSIVVYPNHVVVGRFIYWNASDKDVNSYLIISFDMTTYEFSELYLPDGLSTNDELMYIDNGLSLAVTKISISKIQDSLVVIDNGLYSMTDYPVSVVWMVKDDVFTELYTIEGPKDTEQQVLGFRKTGEPILEICDECEDGCYDSKLKVYEPYSERTTNLQIYGLNGTFSMYSYVESLLLLDHSDCTIND